MEILNSQRAKKVDSKLKAWKYFYKDFVTGDAKCKLCQTVIKVVNQSTGLLRLHLEQVHSIQFQRILQKIDQPKSVNPQLLPTVVQMPSQKPQSSMNLLNLPNGQHDWLSPFIEQVSQGQNQPIEQDKDQYKFIIHCTQFTDPLKYTQFNRYSEQQLTQIREQMSQLTSLHKIPAMVTLAQQQLNQLSISMKKSYVQIMQNKVIKIKLKYDIFQWKIKIEDDMKGNQEIIEQLDPRSIMDHKEIQQQKIDQKVQNIPNKSVINSIIQANYIDLLNNSSWVQHNAQQLFQFLSQNGFIVTQIKKHKKQNIIPPQNHQQNQIIKQNIQNSSDQSLGKTQKQPKLVRNQQTNYESIKQCNCYVFVHERMKEYYSRYADSTLIVCFQANQYVIFLIFVQDWRSNLENIGIIVFQLQQSDESAYSQIIQAAFVIYFNAIASSLPFSITFLPLLSKNQNKKVISSSVKLAYDTFLQQFQNSQGLNSTVFSQIQKEQKEQNGGKQPRVKKLYKKFMERLEQRVKNRIQKLKRDLKQELQLQYQNYLPQICAQFVHNFQNQTKNLTKNHKQEQKTVKVKIRDYINPQSYSGKVFQGFITQMDKIQPIKNIIKAIIQRLQLDQHSKLGFILYTVINVIECNRELFISLQMCNGLAENSKYDSLPSHIKCYQQLLSPNIFRILSQIYCQSETITHLKYNTPTLIEIYSLKIQKQLKAVRQNNLDLAQITQLTETQVKVFKNTAFYNENVKKWMCNCNRICQYGLPCYHIMKILQKMKGSIQYYINQRWKPTQQDLIMLRNDYNEWNARQNGKYTSQMLSQ